MKRAALVLLGLAGCFTPSFNDNMTPCSTDNDCPPGFHCATANMTCWHNGSEPDLAMVSVEPDMSVVDAAIDLSSADLTGIDLFQPVKHQGETCNPSTDTCAAGFQCVDGYCCDSACTETCKACDVPNLHGFCSNVANGTKPSGSRMCNTSAAGPCGLDGFCDGAGNCRNQLAGTNCGAGTCSNGSYVNPSTCDGSGSCVAGSSGNCMPYVCKDATQCWTMCTGSSQCLSPNQCMSGSCGKLSNGQPCSGGNGALCASGHCVDGYCCDSACGAPCQACDVTGKQGTCSTVPGPMGTPHGARTCTGTGTCGGYCNGSATSCTYPGSGVSCYSMCSSMTQVQTGTCNGAGSCAMVTTTCANHFACMGSACDTSCATSSSCASGYGCTPAMTCAKICVYDSDNYDSGCIYAP